MRKSEAKQWRRTSPLAAIFYLGRIFNAIAKNAVQSFAPLAAFVIAYEGDLVTRLVLGGSLFAIGIITIAILRYWFFRYRIAGDSILIREGVLKKTQLDIKFERIQAVNTKQNFIFRPFDLVTVQLDTAGSAKQEGYLPAIKTQLADSLKARLRTAPAINGTDAESETNPIAEGRPLLRLNNSDIIRVGLSSNRALIFLVLLGPLMDNLDDHIDKLLDESTVISILAGTGISINGGIGLVITAVVLIALFMAAASITGAFLRFHQYKLRAEEDTLRSTGGLLTRHEHSINLQKIQSLRAIQNPVLRLFKRFRLRAKQTSSGRTGANKNFVIPISKPDQLEQISSEVFGDEFEDLDLLPRSGTFKPISKSYIRSRFVLFGVIPTVILVTYFSIVAEFLGVFFLVWLPITAFIVWVYYRKYGYAISENGMVLRRGFIGFQTTAFLYRKVQRIGITQSLLQERKGLASIRFYLASGSLRLRYVDFNMAKQLRDYILYKVQSSNQAWH